MFVHDHHLMISTMIVGFREIALPERIVLQPGNPFQETLMLSEINRVEIFIRRPFQPNLILRRHGLPSLQ
jgi:hypothetical protein